MGRKRHHHPKRTSRSDMLKRNKATRGRNTSWQKNLDVIHPSVFNVLNLFNMLLPLLLTFLFGCNLSECGHMQDRLELRFNSFVEGNF
jgi:hypothetical protein